MRGSIWTPREISLSTQLLELLGRLQFETVAKAQYQPSIVFLDTQKVLRFLLAKETGVSQTD